MKQNEFKLLDFVSDSLEKRIEIDLGEKIADFITVVYLVAIFVAKAPVVGILPDFHYRIFSI